MAAVINPQRVQTHRPARPNLVVIEGGRSASVRRQRKVFLRRRILVAVMLLALVWAAATQIGGILGGGEASTGTPAAAASRYVVAPGDTLWEVATGLHVGGDVRDVVDRLAEFNGTDQLVPGQVIEIPSDLAAS